jgi:hypothetical protein
MLNTCYQIAGYYNKGKEQEMIWLKVETNEKDVKKVHEKGVKNVREKMRDEGISASLKMAILFKGEGSDSIPVYTERY